MSANAASTVSDREFASFRSLIYEVAGIHLGESKRALLAARLARRVRQLGLASFSEYYDHVEREGEPELTRLLDAITTNETHFFREPRQFEAIERTVIPSWLEADRPRLVRVWSAGCSTGEEPYSIAMLLHDSLAARGWSIEILATDLSTRVLAQAEEGEWSIERAAEIPERYLKRYMLRGTGTKSGRMAAGDELRAMISFRRLNLNDARWDVEGSFDLIFCRNVLIYFDGESKRRVIARLLDRLAPEGLFLLGHSESLCGWNHGLRGAGPTMYRRPEAGGA
ncbi:MAG TPA: protein-glutamate O-methyltransferase CheR [Thermoanaerobaculia bacterium]